MLKQRLLVGIIGGIFAIIVLCLGAEILSCALGVVSVIGLSEIYNATGILKKQNKLCLASYAFSFLSFIIIAFTETPGMVLALLVFVYGAGLLIYGVFKHGETDFSSIGNLFFQTAYVSFLFAHIVLVRKLPQGEFLIWIIFVTAWLSDTVAFAIGKRFGKNKLLPEISPKKTVEGALGGLAGSALFNLIFGIVCSFAFKLNVNYLSLFFVSIVAGVMSQVGDLAASSVKREYGIKDFSNLLPGHGGILDRFDSVLFVAPTVYYFVVIFSIFA